MVVHCVHYNTPSIHIDATVSNFGEGSGPSYDITCPSTRSDDQECIPAITTSSCPHSMDVGVKCLPFTDACADLVNEVPTTIETTPACNCQQCTIPTQMIAECIPASTGGDGNVDEMTNNNTQPPTSTETSQPSDGATTESSISQSTVMSTSVTLGALIGLLAAALVVVVTGWIVSCVYFQRKINK